MSKEIYSKLIESLSKRGGVDALDIPEFYDLAEELFTPEEAEVACAQPPGMENWVKAVEIGEKIGLSENEVSAVLESMADKGTVMSILRDGIRYYSAPPLAHILDLQFMRGTFTDRDKKLAKLAQSYLEARKAKTGSPIPPLPVWRLISVEETIPVENKVLTYEQISNYIEKYDHISVSSCFCRHKARLIDPDDTCDAPMEVCMTFNESAEYVKERGIGRKISKKEAYEILNKAEEANLVHCSINIKDVYFICNCCTCHCVHLSPTVKRPKLGITLYSSFLPRFSSDQCVSCNSDRICISRCPTNALSLNDDKSVALEEDRCIGCGLCVTSCQMENAVVMELKPEAKEPPINAMALGAEMKKAIEKMGMGKAGRQ